MFLSLRDRTRALTDLKRGNAVNLKSLTDELDCSHLELPTKTKEALGDKIILYH
jgi:hypothetical protein